MTQPAPDLLQVRQLEVVLQTPRGPARALRDVSFDLQRGQTLGLIGESGCGKSMTAMALMGLLPESAQVKGSIRYNGQELVGASGVSGVWLNLGHGASGWTLACGSARAVADSINGKSPDIDLQGLGLERLLSQR